MSQGRRQTFARTFRKISSKRGVFLVFLDFGLVYGPLMKGESETPPLKGLVTAAAAAAAAADAVLTGASCEAAMGRAVPWM